VGRLDNSPGEDTHRERFRRFLKAEVKDSRENKTTRIQGVESPFLNLVRLGCVLWHQNPGEKEGVSEEIAFQVCHNYLWPLEKL